jgi:hypothetical protein
MLWEMRSVIQPVNGCVTVTSAAIKSWMRFLPVVPRPFSKRLDGSCYKNCNEHFLNQVCFCELAIPDSQQA